MTVIDDHIAWIRRDIENLHDQLFKLTAAASPDEEIEGLRAEIGSLEGLIAHYHETRQPAEAGQAAP